jgi:sugar transferase (PEP-CTERM/EpsH1 system associated)
MPRPLRVAHVVLSMELGGLERLVVDLVREGRRLGQQASVVCLERPGKLAAQVEELGVPVYCAEKRPGIRLSTIGRLKKIFRDIQADVVHTHQIGALFYAGPAARAVRVPVIVHTEHGKHYANRLRRRVLGRWAGRYTARFFCVSRDIAAEVAAHRIVPEHKIAIAPNGIDTLRFATRGEPEVLRRKLGIPERAPVIGTIGRLDEIKRQDLLIQAFAKLRETAPDAQLVLVGDGPLRETLQSLASELAVGERVHFAGYQAHPEQYLHLMDVFALTSRSEGMPLVMLEAWAAGVPVVASRVGGLPELIDDGQTGILFTSGDREELVRALHCLLASPELAARMGGAGRSQVEREFTLARMAEQYQRSYLELLCRAPEPVTTE